MHLKKQSKNLIELPLVRQIECTLCGSKDFTFKFAIRSSHFENFQVVSCKDCELVQVNPQPNIATCKPYYNDSYFLVRDKAGYNNYYSQEIQNEITRVYNENLRDLNFFEFEKNLFNKNDNAPKLIDKDEAQEFLFLDEHKKEIIKPKKEIQKKKPLALDVGCASGYFVELLKNRGWEAEGIDIAEGPIRVAKQRKLKVILGDFLENTSIEKKRYDCISFWASLEHMHNPKAVFQRCSQLLKPEGHLILSTCNYSFLAKIQKENWRFMNVPQHLYFFNLEQLQSMATNTGFELVKYITYGSGLTKKKNMNLRYRIIKKGLDALVKKINQGDMIALHFVKRG